MRYPIVIHKDEESSYGVTVPDLPGCFSAGETLDEALELAQDAILGHVETLLMGGQTIPEQRSLELHQQNLDYAGGMWALVDVDLSKVAAKTVRVNITMPSPILSLTDKVAKQEGESRSGLLAKAVLYYVESKVRA